MTGRTTNVIYTKFEYNSSANLVRNTCTDLRGIIFKESNFYGNKTIVTKEYDKNKKLKAEHKDYLEKDNWANKSTSSFFSDTSKLVSTHGMETTYEYDDKATVIKAYDPTGKNKMVFQYI